MNNSARYESLKQAITMSPINKKIVKFLIFCEERELSKALKKEDKNDFLNFVIDNLPKTRQTSKWLKNGGYFKILDWGEQVADERNLSVEANTSGEDADMDSSPERDQNPPTFRRRRRPSNTPSEMSTRPMRAKRNLFGYEGNASSPEYDPQPISSTETAPSTDGVYLEEIDEYHEEVNQAILNDPENLSATIHFEFINVEQSTPIRPMAEPMVAESSPPCVPIEDPPIVFNVGDEDFDGDFFDKNLEQAEQYLTPCDDDAAFNLLHE